MSLRFRFEALTPERWDDFAELFGPRGAVGGCWCMWWRVKKRSDWERDKGATNKRAFKRVVQRGAEPGVLAYHQRQAVGWCAVARREEYPSLERSRVAARVDDRPVWSVSCLFIHKDHRRSRRSVAVLKAAADFVRERGGTIVEGYPVIPKNDNMPGVFAFTGLYPAFLRAGFEEVARRSETRAVMRRRLRPLRSD
jgi:GNAT superfamily N-acetyltransferase